MKRPYPWKCRNCRQLQVNPVTIDYAADLEHDGRTYPVIIKNLEILRCESCGSQVLPDAAHAKLADALRCHAKLLMPSQITAQREALALSQKDFAFLLGVAPATVSRWETGGQIQQRVMNDFMRAFFDLPALRDYLAGIRGFSLAQPVARKESPPPAVAQIPTVSRSKTRRNLKRWSYIKRHSSVLRVEGSIPGTRKMLTCKAANRLSPSQSSQSAGASVCKGGPEVLALILPRTNYPVRWEPQARTRKSRPHLWAQTLPGERRTLGIRYLTAIRS